MQRSQRLDRDRRIIEYLATPRRDEMGELFVDTKGNLVFPTQREAGDLFDLEKYTIARIKKRMINFYNEVKKRHEQQTDQN